MKNKALFTSDSNEWYTPEYIIKELEKRYGKFDLDPCATKESAKALNYYTKEDDGLSKKWNGNVFVNPPYGREISKWVEKSYIESRDNTQIIMLIPARTDTKYWHNYIFKYANEILFIKGRIKFETIKGKGESAPFPSAIIVFNTSFKYQYINTIEF